MRLYGRSTTTFTPFYPSPIFKIEHFNPNAPGPMVVIGKFRAVSLWLVQAEKNDLDQIAAPHALPATVRDHSPALRTAKPHQRHPCRSRYRPEHSERVMDGRYLASSERPLWVRLPRPRDRLQAPDHGSLDPFCRRTVNRGG